MPPRKAASRRPIPLRFPCGSCAEKKLSRHRSICHPVRSLPCSRYSLLVYIVYIDFSMATPHARPRRDPSVISTAILPHPATACKRKRRLPDCSPGKMLPGLLLTSTPFRRKSFTLRCRIRGETPTDNWSVPGTVWGSDAGRFCDEQPSHPKPFPASLHPLVSVP